MLGGNSRHDISKEKILIVAHFTSHLTSPKGYSMPTIHTCGPANKRTEFTYHGTATDGVTLEHATPHQIPASVFRAVLERFQGQTVPAGVTANNPTPGGIGEFIGGLGLGQTPRHGSFLCAILCHEGLATSTLRGNAIYITFPS